MQQDPAISDQEVALLFAKLPYGLANLASIEFSYLPRAADDVATDHFSCQRHAPEDLARFEGADALTLPARVRRLTPRGRTELLDRVVRLGDGTRTSGRRWD